MTAALLGLLAGAALELARAWLAARAAQRQGQVPARRLECADTAELHP